MRYEDQFSIRTVRINDTSTTHTTYRATLHFRQHLIEFTDYHLEQHYDSDMDVEMQEQDLACQMQHTFEAPLIEYFEEYDKWELDRWKRVDIPFTRVGKPLTNPKFKPRSI